MTSVTMNGNSIETDDNNSINNEFINNDKNNNNNNKNNNKDNNNTNNNNNNNNNTNNNNIKAIAGNPWPALMLLLLLLFVSLAFMICIFASCVSGAKRGATRKQFPPKCQ